MFRNRCVQVEAAIGPVLRLIDAISACGIYKIGNAVLVAQTTVHVPLVHTGDGTWLAMPDVVSCNDVLLFIIFASGSHLCIEGRGRGCRYGDFRPAHVTFWQCGIGQAADALVFESQPLDIQREMSVGASFTVYFNR